MTNDKRLPIDLNIMFVDHLVDGLEKRSIARILDFLVSYCGKESLLEYLGKDPLPKVILEIKRSCYNE